eukprot:768733-Hanusia_phi.AAC.2
MRESKECPHPLQQPGLEILSVRSGHERSLRACGWGGKEQIRAMREEDGEGEGRRRWGDGWGREREREEGRKE